MCLWSCDWEVNINQSEDSRPPVSVCPPTPIIYRDDSVHVVRAAIRHAHMLEMRHTWSTVCGCVDLCLRVSLLLCALCDLHVSL